MELFVQKFENIKKKNFRRFDVRNLNRTKILSRQGRPPTSFGEPRVRGDNIEKIGPSADMARSVARRNAVRFDLRSDLIER